MSAAALTGDERAALAGALAAEHAAVYAYGLVAAYAAPQRAVAVDGAARVHRDRRDALDLLLRSQGADAPPALAAYDVGPLTDGTGAAALALRVEDATAVAWRAVLERSEPGDLRGTALDALLDAATRASGWRVALGQDPLATFPGRP